MKAAACLSFLLTVLAVPPVLAADVDSVRIMVPLSGTYGLIGRQVAQGAREIEPDIRIVDSQCEEARAGELARAAVAEGVTVIAGLVCVEAADAVKEAIRGTDVAAISIGVRADDLTRPERKNSAVSMFRLGAPLSDDAAVLAAHLKDNWRDKQFAIIDDGTLQGRQFAEDIRFILEEDELRAVFTDTYRPLLDNQVALVRRLARAGATHVVIGGDAYDVSIIGQDAARLNISLTIAGGSALIAPAEDGQLPDGTLVAAPSGEVTGTSWYVETGREAARLALQAAESGETARQGLVTADRGETFGADGELRISPVQVWKIENGKPVAVTTPQARTGADG